VNLHFFIAVVLSYVLGSTPTAVIVGKILGVDVRHHGSRNPGATNLARLSGKRSWGAFALTIDALKGFIPAYFGYKFILLLGPTPFGWTEWTVRPLLGAAAILGHVFSIYLGLRGGKGVATSLGVALALSPVVGLACFFIWAVLAELTRRISISSLVAGIVFPALLNFYHATHPAVIWFGWILPLFLLFTHRENLLRLFRGEEPAIPQERLVRNLFSSTRDET
jgi:acyl phosphate:glycerol-3-phosphate acyltransferase